MSALEFDTETIKEWAKSVSMIERVWLFGSRIKGTERHDSDLDIAVEHGVLHGDHNAFTTAIGEIDNWQTQLQSKVSFTVDLQSYIPGITPTIEAALNESSQLIYQKSHGDTP